MFYIFFWSCSTPFHEILKQKHKALALCALDKERVLRLLKANVFSICFYSPDAARSRLTTDPATHRVKYSKNVKCVTLM